MKYDIVPINDCYRGIDRTFLASDLYTKQSKRQYDTLLEMYYEYLSIVEQKPTEYGMLGLINLYKELCNCAIECELIVYANNQLQAVFGYNLTFLGVDIVYEMAESLLSDYTSDTVKKYLNENGLCDLETNIYEIIPLLDHGEVKWEPCYVYKVNIT